MSAEELSLDAVLGILANEYRRRLLGALLERDSPADRDARVRWDAITGDEDPERLGIHMVHNHLPKLERAGLIERDTGANEVRRGPRFEDIRPLLHSIHDHVDELHGDRH